MGACVKPEAKVETKRPQQATLQQVEGGTKRLQENTLQHVEGETNKLQEDTQQLVEGETRRQQDGAIDEFTLQPLEVNGNEARNLQVKGDLTLGSSLTIRKPWGRVLVISG
jgi:hypothetical protein